MSNEAFERAVKAIAGMHKDMVDPYAVVRTVLEAVREPSYDMALKGFDELDREVSSYAAVNCFKAMVDELLKP